MVEGLRPERNLLCYVTLCHYWLPVSHDTSGNEQLGRGLRFPSALLVAFLRWNPRTWAGVVACVSSAI